MRNDKWWMFAALGIVAAGCGRSYEPPPQAPSRGAESETKATNAPTPHATSAERSPLAGAAPVMEAPAPSPSPPPAPEPAEEAPSAADPHARYMRANVQFSEAKRQVDIAAGQRDCGNACRALDSMERAMNQLCDLARSSEERRTCKSAEDEVRSARERVRKACGDCPKGAR